MNAAALRDLEMFEAYFLRDAETHRFMEREEEYHLEMEKARIVRQCIDMILEAEEREPD